jgi:hypothetical protein
LEKHNLFGDYSALAVAALSAVGAVATLGLFRWELRNIQKCNWLISRAARFETQVLKAAHLQFHGMAKKEHLEATDIAEIHTSSFFRTPWGKTQAEKLIYLAAIGAWLVPFALAVCILFRGM